MRANLKRLALPALAALAATAAPNTAAQADMLFAEGKLADAQKIYAQLVQADPDDHLSETRLGFCYAGAGDYLKAAEAFQLVTRFPFDRGEAHYNRACMLSLAKKPDQAMAELQKAMENGFFRTSLLVSDTDLDSLRPRKDFQTLAKKLLGQSFGDTVPSSGPTKAQMQDGIRQMVSKIVSHHPNPFRIWSREEWARREAAAVAKAPSMDEAAYFCELLKFAAAVGDVHTSAFAGTSKVMSSAVPIQFWMCSDGLRIVSTAPELKHLVGAEVLAIGETPTEQFWPRLSSEYLEENEYMAAIMLQFFLRFPDFVRSVGLHRSAEEIPLKLRLQNGQVQTVTLKGASNGGYSREMGKTLDFPTPEGWSTSEKLSSALWMTKPRDNYWYEVLPDHKAVYFQFNIPRDRRARPWAAFLDELIQAINESNAERLVIDLRNNPGGSGFMGYDLVRKLREVPQVNRPGYLFVITSRMTQSAGVVISVALEQQADAVFVGEPAGAHPNIFNGRWGNHPKISLPGTGINYRVSEVQEQNSDSLDQRRFIAPDFPVPVAWSDLASGRDPALELCLSVPHEEAAAKLLGPGGRSLPAHFRWQRRSQWEAWGEVRPKN